jgi:hypothetical protein
LLAVHASADETDDRLGDRFAIARVIASLNDATEQKAAFTPGDDGLARLQRLRKSAPTEAFRIMGPFDGRFDGELPQLTDYPTVTISHEPWGEATFTVGSQAADEIRRGIVFITADVALAEGACRYQDTDGSQKRKPLLFVMKKEGGYWRIASILRLVRE